MHRLVANPIKSHERRSELTEKTLGKRRTGTRQTFWHINPRPQHVYDEKLSNASFYKGPSNEFSFLFLNIDSGLNNFTTRIF